MRPADRVFTGIYQPEGESERVIGQVRQSSNLSSALLGFILKSDQVDPQKIVAFLEGVIKQVGEWGAKQVVADLDISSEIFSNFRQAGFSVMAKQRVYHYRPVKREKSLSANVWRTWTSLDIPAVQRLYSAIVPPLLQPVEPLTRRESLGLVYYDEQGDLQAYADLVYGPIGLWVLPMIHPRTSGKTTELLVQMLHDLPGVNNRSVYISVRSYQPWVEEALVKLNVNPGPEQALLVRYLTLQQRVETEFSFTAIENGKAEPTMPVARIKRQQNKDFCP